MCIMYSRVSDPGGVYTDPDPSFEEKPDSDPDPDSAFEKNKPIPDPTSEKKPDLDSNPDPTLEKTRPGSYLIFRLIYIFLYLGHFGQ